MNKDYDYINPSHYQQGSKEVWEMMVNIWGKEAFIKHCEMCAFKYRMRVGMKPDQPIDRDLNKAQWYEDKARELKRQTVSLSSGTFDVAGKVGDTVIPPVYKEGDVVELAVAYSYEGGTLPSGVQGVIYEPKIGRSFVTFGDDVLLLDNSMINYVES